MDVVLSNWKVLFDGCSTSFGVVVIIGRDPWVATHGYCCLTPSESGGWGSGNLR